MSETETPASALIVNRGYLSTQEMTRRRRLIELFHQNPIPEDEQLSNLALFIPKTEFARILYINDLYKDILRVHGVIMEFGVRWGQNLALFETLRGIYEPFNRSRTIVGFDTFAGFPAVSVKDGQASFAKPGGYAVSEGYEQYLEQLLDCHEQEGVTADAKKYELVKGDASFTVEDYLKRHPETIISLAYFDMDIYEPTLKCLKAIRKHVTKGSVIAFDELNFPACPGETIAVSEVFGLEHVRLVHTPFSSFRAYFIVD